MDEMSWQMKGQVRVATPLKNIEEKLVELQDKFVRSTPPKMIEDIVSEPDNLGEEETDEQVAIYNQESIRQSKRQSDYSSDQYDEEEPG